MRIRILHFFLKRNINLFIDSNNNGTQLVQDCQREQHNGYRGRTAENELDEEGIKFWTRLSVFHFVTMPFKKV